MKIKPQILCTLTEWKEVTGKKGKASGKVTCERVVLAADKYNWIVAKEKKGTPGVLLDKAYVGNMKSVLNTLPLEGDIKDMINRIIGSLVNKTGIMAQLKADDPYKDLKALGRWIDNSFNTSFHFDSEHSLFAKLFKLDPNLEVDE